VEVLHEGVVDEPDSNNWLAVAVPARIAPDAAVEYKIPPLLNALVLSTKFAAAPASVNV